MTDDGFVDRPCGAKHDFPDVGRNGSAQVPEAKSVVAKSLKGISTPELTLFIQRENTL